MANITRIEFTATTIYVYLSDGTMRCNLYTQANVAFLYSATPQQRENWTFAQKDRAITWPDLGETLLLGDKGNLVRYEAPVTAPEPIAETV
jgi:hypothetical protein